MRRGVWSPLKAFYSVLILIAAMAACTDKPARDPLTPINFSHNCPFPEAMFSTSSDCGSEEDP